MPPSHSAPCPDLVELENFLANGSADARVLRHLEQCPACRMQLEKIGSNNDFLGAFAKAARKPGRDSATSSSQQPFVTDTVPGYKLLSEIHRGGQGVVYKAVQTATKRRVALKVLAHKHSLSERQRHRFDREVEVVAGLRHPNIVTVYDSGTTQDGRHFFAMELISGSTLDIYIALTKPTIRDTVRLIAKVARAVQYAHQRGVIHRDLKPANVIIDSSGEPHLVDFGVAKFPGSGVGGNLILSVTGEFIGTLSYASPEQVSGNSDQVDIRTDVYSLGVVLYESLTGRLPYLIGGSISNIAHTISETQPEPPSRANTAIVNELETIVLMALAKDRMRRYQSAGELAEDLERYLSDLAISAKRDSTWYILKKTARRYRIHAALAACFVAFLAVFGVLMAVQRGQAINAKELSKRQARDLAQLLSESNIERGRALARMGTISLAESLIWSEFLNPPQGKSASARSAAAAHPGSTHAYWALWELYFRSGCLTTFQAHHDRVRLLDLSSAGDLLASCGNDGTIRLWRMPGGEPLATLRSESDSVASVLFSPDGRMLLSRDDPNGSVTIWNVGAQEKICQFGEQITFACFNPDGLTVATGDKSGSVRLWDVETQVCKAVVHKGGDTVWGVCFSPQGTLLAWASGQTVNVWDGLSIQSREISNRFPVGIRNVHFDREHQTLFFSHGGDVWRWEKPFTESPNFWITHGTGSISSLDFSRDGRILASGSLDRTLKLWDAATGQCTRTLAGHTNAVNTVCFAAEDSMLISSGEDRTIRIWDLADGPARRLVGSTDTVHSIAFSPDGTQLASCSADQDMTLRTWDWRIGLQSQMKTLPESGVIHAVAYSPDGRLLATASEDRKTRLWDTSTWDCVRTLDEHSDSVNSVAFSPDGQFLASGSRDKTIKLWETDTWTCKKTLEGHTSRVVKVRFSPDAHTLASCSSDRTIMLWDIASRHVLATLTDHNDVVRAIAFSPDGKKLASGADNSEIRLWDSQAGKSLATLDGHQQAVYSVAFSPDGRLLASSTSSGEIKVWDAHTHRNLLTLQEATGQAVFGVAFSPDGDTLASAGSDRMIHLWDLKYYQRHIAGNLEYQLREYSTKHGEPPNADALRAWARSILQDIVTLSRTYRDHFSMDLTPMEHTLVSQEKKEERFRQSDP